MNKIKEFLYSEGGKRLIYEAKSFLMTFIPTYISITGLTSSTPLEFIINNKEVLLSSIGIALTRTIVIYGTKLIGYDYRQNTINYK